MRPTRRGYATIAVLLAAVAMAWTFGGRALNAVVAPAVVALAAGLVQAWLADPPTVSRTALEPGFPGETRTVELTVEGTDGATATIVDSVPEGFESETDEVGSSRTTRRLTSGAERTGFGSDVAVTLVHTMDATLPATVRYDVAFDRRGEHTVGPVTVRVRDALGLFERTFEDDRTESVLVYPTVRQLHAGAERLVQDAAGAHAVESGGFAEIREYVPGDPMRKIHWKSSAKHPDKLFVSELETERDGSGDVSIAVHGTERVDDLASAAASLAAAALDTGYRVELTVPETEVAAGRGQTHRTRLLTVLARTDGGDVGSTALDRADVEVRPGTTGVDVVVHGERVGFESLWQGGDAERRTDAERPAVAEGAT